MPKDPTENIARYKVRGGHLNEYEFQENQGALADQQKRDTENLIPGTPPQPRAQQLQQLTKRVAASKKKKSAASSAPSKTPKKAGAKNAASTKKAASRKTGAKKKAKK